MNNINLEEEQKLSDEFSLDLAKKKKKSTKIKETIKEDNNNNNNSNINEIKENEIPQEEKEYSYMELLDRVYSLLKTQNPDLTTKKRHTIPQLQVLRIGTRKTMWSNFNQICLTMR